MEIKLISLNGCGKCETVKNLLIKKQIKFYEIKHEHFILDEYPIIIVDTKRYSYLEFLKMYKKLGEEKK